MKHLLTFESFNSTISRGAMIEHKNDQINKIRRKLEKEKSKKEEEHEDDEDRIDPSAIDPAMCIIPEIPSKE